MVTNIFPAIAMEIKQGICFKDYALWFVIWTHTGTKPCGHKVQGSVPVSVVISFWQD